jgi:hypothetical protein
MNPLPCAEAFVIVRVTVRAPDKAPVVRVLSALLQVLDYVLPDVPLRQFVFTVPFPADRDGKGLMFHPAPAPSQDEIESLVGRASKRILRFLQRRKVITLVTAPGASSPKT